MEQAKLIDSMLKEEYIIIDVECENKEQLLEYMVEVAKDNGLVKDSYLKAVLEREENYPTGLPTPGMCVALPHTTEKKHVIKSGIIIAKLKKPVAFKEMGNGVEDIMAEMVLMLAVNGNEEQLSVLRGIVGMFADKASNSAFKNASTKTEILELITSRIS